jgi:hypothetical protein
MGAPKKPKAEHGICCNFRIKKKQIKRLEEHADKYNCFKNRTAVIKWCINMGDTFLSGDMEEIFIMLDDFMKKNIGEPEDPRQKDIFEEKRIQMGIQMREGYLEGKQRMKEALTQ